MRGSGNVRRVEPSTKQNALSFGYVSWQSGHCFIAQEERIRTGRCRTTPTAGAAGREDGEDQNNSLIFLMIPPPPNITRSPFLNSA